MNADLFYLRHIKAPRLESAALEQSISRLEKMTHGWENGGTASTAGLLDEFRKQFREGLLKGLPFEEYTRSKRR